MRPSRRHLALVLTAVLAEGVMAQSAEPDDTIPSLKPQIVTSTRSEAPPFEVPASIDVVAGDDMRKGQLQVNLSESLGGIPGLLVQNRQNYAQDLQLSVRGFGARSTFGIRGVRLYVDGIPATMPDGQGQSSNIDIASADRVEVLRGPFSALYGNSSGGVVQVFSEEGEGPPTVSTSIASGSNGLRRYGLKASGATDSGIDYVLSTSRFTTDGWREHSETSKNLTNARMGIKLSEDSSLTLVLNSVSLRAQDPLGLTAAQLASNPRGAALAQQYNTRKTVDQTQGGLVYERRIDADNSLRLMLYSGTRQTVQFQSIPPAAQASATHAGGVISLAREYGGLDARWTSRLLLAGQPLTLVGGVNYDTLTEQRQGFQNFTGTVTSPQLGVLGALRRDETNRVTNLDPYLQANWRMAERWTVEAGLRYSTVRFSSDDHYIVGANGNDSGTANYKKALPMAALRYEANPALNLYATIGRGFETPTFNELSYRRGGLSGLNFTLQPSVNTSVEVGAKQRVTGGLLTAALFQTRTDNEIVTDTNSGGRSTFRNAGRTQRNGLELGWNTSIARHWRVQTAYTWLNATYQDGFCTSPCIAANAVAAGNRIPGIARQVAQASLDWTPPTGWRAGVQARYVGAIPVNDLNSESAASVPVLALHAGYLARLQHWEISSFARVDNVLNRQYVGSVIVNEGNTRFYESAPGRNWAVGVSAAYRF